MGGKILRTFVSFEFRDRKAVRSCVTVPYTPGWHPVPGRRVAAFTDAIKPSQALPFPEHVVLVNKIF
jgi:hypothetical protein